MNAWIIRLGLGIAYFTYQPLAASKWQTFCHHFTIFFKSWLHPHSDLTIQLVWPDVPTGSHQGLRISFIPGIKVIHVKKRLIFHSIYLDKELRCHPCTPGTLIQFRETDTHLNGPHRIQSGLYALTEVQTYIGFKGNFNCTLGRNGNLKERGIELGVR